MSLLPCYYLFLVVLCGQESWGKSPHVMSVHGGQINFYPRQSYCQALLELIENTGGFNGAVVNCQSHLCQHHRFKEICASRYGQLKTFQNKCDLCSMNCELLNDGEKIYDELPPGVCEETADVIRSCPENMVYGNCTCGGTCEQPNGSSGCLRECELGTQGCFCPAGFVIEGDDCVPQSDCPCFWPDNSQIIPEGETYVNANCTIVANCTDGQLIWDNTYRCSSNATCEDRNSIHGCVCDEGLFGDGEMCDYATDCTDVYNAGSTLSAEYTIKPQNWSGSPFRVYCNMADRGGWTVIHRRSVNGTINFNRDWDSYKEGFGNVSRAFWIGNEMLSYLTNQRNYQLLVEMSLSNGSEVTVSYSNFRVGDEVGGYRLLSMAQYSGTTDSISWCPSKMLYGNCTCGQRLCQDPRSCRNTCEEGHLEGCICPDGFYTKNGACLPEQECGCYISEEQTIVSEGETFVNTNCTMVAACSNGTLTWNDTFECSPNAVCKTRDNDRKCYCNEGFFGDGEKCDTSTDCMDIYNAVSTDSGVYRIKPRDWPRPPFEVYCNMTDGGGWTVFQRRIDGDVDFYRDWNSYKQGFGDVDDEHWLGNEQLYYLTNQGSYQLRVDFVNQYGAPYYSKFASFGITNEVGNYELSDVGTYSGTAGDALRGHRGYQFSTKDRDNDGDGGNHCAQLRHGAWWYHGCTYSQLKRGLPLCEERRS